LAAIVIPSTERRVKVPELSRAEVEFYLANGFEVYRHWHYMELDAGSPAAGPELPDSYRWHRIDQDGIEDWVLCHNETFRGHWDYRELDVESVRGFVGQPHRGLFGISGGDELVGVSSYDLRRTLPRRTGVIWSIGVARAHRGRGLGRALAMGTISHLMGAGMNRIGLFVDEENTIAYGLYRKLGFRPVERSLILRKVQ